MTLPLRPDLQSFLTSETGAVTVDMVPLLAVCVGLGLAVMGVVSGGVETLSSDSSDALAAVELRSTFAEPETGAGDDAASGSAGDATGGDDEDRDIGDRGNVVHTSAQLPGTGTSVPPRQR